MMTEAQKRANKKYLEKNYKNLTVKLKFAEIEYIDNYCKSIGLSKAQTIVKAIKYCSEYNINLTEYTPSINTDNISIEDDPD